MQNDLSALQGLLGLSNPLIILVSLIGGYYLRSLRGVLISAIAGVIAALLFDLIMAFMPGFETQLMTWQILSARCISALVCGLSGWGVAIVWCLKEPNESKG